MMLTCQRCDNQFEKTNKRGPIPKYCSDACKAAKHRQRNGSTERPKSTPATTQGQKQGLTLRDVVNVAQLDLSVKQCDVVIEAFTKARLRAARRERDAAAS